MPREMGAFQQAANQGLSQIAAANKGDIFLIQGSIHSRSLSRPYDKTSQSVELDGENVIFTGCADVAEA